MSGQLSREQIFLLAAWFEAIAYGLFLCLFCGTMLFALGSKHRSDNHSKIMFCISFVMFAISTTHMSMNGWRVLQGFSVHSDNVFAYLDNLTRWDQVFKDTLYVTQELLGGAAAIYRCFIVWNSRWRVIALPLLLLVGGAVSGYGICFQFTQAKTNPSIFVEPLSSWIYSFYSLAVAQNIITTALLAFCPWRAAMRSAKYKTEKKNFLLPIVRILIESAALQLFVEILLLALYSQKVDAQDILLELVTPAVGITFNAITIRLKLRAMQNSSSTSVFSTSDPVQTIGHLPMKRIRVDISREIEDDADAKPTLRGGSNDQLSAV
ncbi:hypothetical protein AB1N83_008955 [Pleurotus pulmonarius]|nr:hypothetical protein EYR38_003075 [Pleurotus pulmonarius]